MQPAPREPLFGRLPLAERVWFLRAARNETVGGLVLLAAAVIALVWANSPWGDAYETVSDTVVGPSALHLDLSLATWAADGLLAIFFFVAGLELKHEFVRGSLSSVSRAAVPVAAALGGMLVPAVLFTVVNVTADDGAPGGWGIPMATDIAFALAVLAVVGSGLPIALRAFLLSLAVVDDLGAILVIALFYSDSFSLWPFLGAIACFVLYAWLQHRRIRTAWIYVPLALVAWDLVHASGIHATVAGIAFGLLTRVRPDPGEAESPSDRLERRVQPWSAAICVPLFAFFAAGVDLRGQGLTEALSTPVAIGVIVGLVVGKPIGVLAAAWLTARFTRASLSPALRWADVATVGLLGGIGFTVALLIDELAFPTEPDLLSSGKVAVLAASVLAAVLATIALRARNRAHRALAAEEEADVDGDGIPDVYQRGED